MSYDAKAIANYFLELASVGDEGLEHMKLQKLVYLAHGWNLALRDARLFDNEIQAWEFGPVIPTLYHEFKDWGRSPILERASEYDDRSGSTVELRVDDYPGDNDFTRALLDRIWDVFGSYTAIQLSNMSHAPGTPWGIVNKEHNGSIPKGTPIPDGTIRDYFVLQVNQPAAAQ